MQRDARWPPHQLSGRRLVLLGGDTLTGLTCCDMSCDCLSKYHGRASRDALRVWSGWASTVIHGPRYEPDYGPCYALGRRATPRVGPPGSATRRAAGPRYAPGRRAALRAGPRAALHAGPTTAPPCRWTFGPTDGRRRYIPMDIEDPRPWSLQPDSWSRLLDYSRTFTTFGKKRGYYNTW